MAETNLKEQFAEQLKKKKRKKDKIMITLNIDPGLKDRLDTASAVTGLTRSEIIRECIDSCLPNYK